MGFARLMLAVFIIYTHTPIVVAGLGNIWWIDKFLRETVGIHRSQLFFLLAGFLTAASLSRTKSIWMFARRRMHLVIPMWYICMFSVVLLGAIVTSLPAMDYFTHLETIQYLFVGVTFTKVPESLPGVFDTHPFNGANISAWFPRVLVALTIAHVCFEQWQRKGEATVKLFFVGVSIIIGTLLHEYLQVKVVGNFVDMALPYVIGVGFFQYKERIVVNRQTVILSGALIGAMFALALLGLPASRILLLVPALVIMGYVLLCWSLLPACKIARWYNNQVGDIAYAVIVFSFPIQQLVFTSAPQLTWWEHFMTATAITLPMAWLVTIITTNLVQFLQSVVVIRQTATA